MVALCLVVLLSVTALAIDGGVLLQERRQAQAAADTAALAAAADLFENFPASGGRDARGTARASALAVAAANGYGNDGRRSSVVVNIPPQSGLFVNRSGYVEVIIQHNESRGFSRIMGNGAIPIRARAVARGRWDMAPSIITLDPTRRGSLAVLNGSGDIQVSRGSVTVNSNHAEGAIDGTASNLIAPTFSLAGGYATSASGRFVGDIRTNGRQVPDPLAYLPAPDPASLAVRTPPLRSKGVHRLEPGRYAGGLTFTGDETVHMEPGIYYMDGGGFTFASSGDLRGNGVMIYTQRGVNIRGTGSVSLSPYSSGVHQGITFFQDRNSSAPIVISHSAGNGNYLITGGIYGANSGVLVNRKEGDQSIGSQFISRTLVLTGSGNLTISGNGARTRIIGLVE
jgi:hypothetical protein